MSNLLHELSARALRWNRRRAVAADMRRLDERILRDIGLTRESLLGGGAEPIRPADDDVPPCTPAACNDNKVCCRAA